MLFNTCNDKTIIKLAHTYLNVTSAEVIVISFTSCVSAVVIYIVFTITISSD